MVWAPVACSSLLSCHEIESKAVYIRTKGQLKFLLHTSLSLKCTDSGVMAHWSQLPTLQSK